MNALPTLRLPEIDLPRVDRPTIELPQSLAEFGLRPRRRPRWPFALALAAAGLTGWAILNNDRMRARLARLVPAVRERISALRATDDDRLARDGRDPIAFPAAETRPIQDDPLTNAGSDDAPDYPPGLGSNNDDGIPAFEDSASRG